MTERQTIKVKPNAKGEIVIRLYGTDYLIEVQETKKTVAKKADTTTVKE